METAEFAAIIRDMIRHEDTLRDQRLGWLFALNGFLFAGLSVAWPDENSGPLVIVLAVVGVLVAISSAAVLARSAVAIDKLAARASERTARDEEEVPPVIALRSKELQEDNGASRWVKATGPLVPWKMVPKVLALAWAVLPVLWWFAR